MIMTNEKTNWYSELDATLAEMTEHSNRLRAINNVVKKQKKFSLFNLVNTYNDENSLKIRKEQNKIIKKIFKKEITNESVQDFLKIFTSPHISIRVFWAVSIVLSVGLTSYLVIQSILTYLSYGVNTTTRNIVENPTDFPKITICNNNQFTTAYAVNFLKQINKQVEPNIDIFDKTQMEQLSLSDKVDYITTIYTAAVSVMTSDNLTDADRKKLGHSLDDILYKCTFNQQPCSSDDFIWKFDRFYGNCFVFNSGFNATGKTEIKKSLISGSLYGLQLQFYVGFNDELSLFNSIYAKGGFLKIENSSFLLDDTLDGIFLTPGLSPYIPVERQFEYYLPKPYSNCDIDNDSTSPTKFNSYLYNLIFYSKYEYSQQLCFNQCMQRQILIKCNCTDPTSLSLFNNSITCKSDDEQTCMNDQYTSMLSQNYITTTCVSQCPLECKRTRFKAFISSCEVLGDLYYDYLLENANLAEDFVYKNITIDTARDSFSFALIYYESNSYTVSSETPTMDVVALLANLGGTMGLFLGVSLMHVCEVIDVLMQIYFIKKNFNKVKPFYQTSTE